MLTRSLTQPLTGPLVRGVGEGGVTAAWAGALPALRTFVTANYNQPNPHNQAVMASPPTITVSDTTQPSGLTTEYKYVAGTATMVSFYGGAQGPLGNYVRFPVVRWKATGGNVGNGQNAVSWRAGFVANAQKVSVSFLETTPPARFIVDGKYVSLAGTTLAGTGGRCYVQLDFGTKASRTIYMENELDTGFELVGIAPGDSVTAIPGSYKRMIVLGDSFTEGFGATRRGDGFSLVAGDMLGIRDTWQSGIGGTGYIATNGGTSYILSQRLSDANSTGPWDVIVMAMGINDISVGAAAADVTAQVQTCIASLRANNPAAQIFVVGPWDSAAPSAVDASYGPIKAAIKAGVPAGAGVTFLDPQGVSFTKYSDGTHPDTAGHATLGAWLALQIKTALGA